MSYFKLLWSKHQTWKTTFGHIFKREESWKYDAQRSILTGFEVFGKVVCMGSKHSCSSRTKYRAARRRFRIPFLLSPHFPRFLLSPIFRASLSRPYILFGSYGKENACYASKKSGWTLSSVFHVIYQTRETVFHRNMKTPRRELKLWRAAEYFRRNLRCLNSPWNTASSVW